MRGFNRVIVAGNLTRDPELSYTASNVAICKLGMAIGRSFKDRDGNLKEETCFVDLTAFGRQAETINQYMSKGRPLLVEGRLNFRQWTDKEGKNRSKLDVVVENFQFLGDRGGGQGGGAGAAQRGPGMRQSAPATAAPTGGDEPPPMEDVPPPNESEIPF